MASERRTAGRRGMISEGTACTWFATTSIHPTSGCPSGSGMSGGMKASGDAAAAMFEHASVMTSEITMIADRQAVRNIGTVIEKYGAAVPGRSPRAETPAEAGVDANWNSRIEGKPDSPYDTGWRRQYDEARVGYEQRAPNAPGVVIGNVNQSRIDRHNLDQAGVDNHTLLGGGNQHVRLLCLQPHGLDRVHDVSGLVVIGVAELRSPSGVLCQVVESRGKLGEALNGRIP
jgi:hypothetical protein